MPSLAGATGWLNSPPLTRESLRGKVVLVDFWTYSCINCLRALALREALVRNVQGSRSRGHRRARPEFAFESDPDNVRRAVGELGITYPVAIDDDYAIWRGFNNQYWPAHYFIDAEGRIRGHHFGEGDYEDSERIIRELLTEAGYKDLPPAGAAPTAAGHRGGARHGARCVAGDLHRLSPRGRISLAWRLRGRPAEKLRLAGLRSS